MSHSILYNCIYSASSFVAVTEPTVWAELFIP